jgi:hypothetical protein
LAVGFALLVTRSWAWGAARTIGTIGGVFAYVGGVIIFVLTYGFVEAGGLKIAYERVGQGPP